jgi:transposase
MPRQSTDTIAVLGIDIGKNTFHLVGLNERGAIILRRKLSRGQLEAKLANLLPCLIGMEACVGAHHLSRRLKALGHDARLMPARYVRAYLKGNKNDFRDAEAIAEAVQRPTMRFVAPHSRNYAQRTVMLSPRRDAGARRGFLAGLTPHILGCARPCSAWP